MAKAVQNLFDEIAPRYDFLNHFLSLNIDAKWRDQALLHLQDRACQHILDLCAGTLDLTQRLLEIFPKVRMTALDFSQAMLEAGRKKISDPSRCQLLCADGHLLPFAEGSYDAVVCAFGIRNLEHREQAAKEIFRVLKPGGSLVVLEFFKPEKLFPKLFYQTYGKYVIPKVGGLISKNRKAYQYLQDSIQNFLSIVEYEKLLSSIGFVGVQSKALSGGIAHEVYAEKKV
ncbi:MAG: ubiquinone/menaquinone biosynthesis methyltransferase [bacterium]|nr:ubiquinone/menaquinone biosynthesis methyltransferase [bacterium]